MRKLTREEEEAGNIGDETKKEESIKVKTKIKKTEVKTMKKSAKKKAKKNLKERVQRPKSKSGNYKNIRHLVEHVFAKKKDATAEETAKIVKKEFPTSAFNNLHYSWYKTHIINKREFIHESMPKWAKGHSAKIK